MSIRVILADDHGVVLDGLCRLLETERDIKVVGTAPDGRTAVAIAKELKPDVVVLDVAMGDMNGITAVAKIIRQRNETKVLALSMHTSGQIVSDMLRGGASGYVVKSSNFEELLQAIRLVAAGKTYLSPEIAGGVVRQITRSASSTTEMAGPLLSDRESEVLQLVSEGNTTRGIAAALHVSIKTIETHRHSIMKKLDIHSVAGLTRYAIREGLTPLNV